MRKMCCVSCLAVMLLASANAKAEFIQNGSFTGWYDTWTYGPACPPSYQANDWSHTQWGGWVLGYHAAWVGQTINATALPSSQGYEVGFWVANAQAPLESSHQILVEADYYDSTNQVISSAIQRFDLAVNRDWQNFTFSSTTPSNVDHTFIYFQRLSNPESGSQICLDTITGTLVPEPMSLAVLTLGTLFCSRRRIA